MSAHLNAVATAVPPYDRHREFIDSLPHWIPGEELAAKVRQIALQSRIDRRTAIRVAHAHRVAGAGTPRPAVPAHIR